MVNFKLEYRRKQQKEASLFPIICNIIARVKPNQFFSLRLFSTRRRLDQQLAGWMALLAILFHMALPFAHSLGTQNVNNGIFCGTLTPAAKLALAKMPDGGALLTKLVQHDCSECAQAHTHLVHNTNSVQVWLVSIVKVSLRLYFPSFLPSGLLHLTASPPPSHAPPLFR